MIHVDTNVKIRAKSNRSRERMKKSSGVGHLSVIHIMAACTGHCVAFQLWPNYLFCFLGWCGTLQPGGWPWRGPFMNDCFLWPFSPVFLVSQQFSLDWCISKRKSLKSILWMFPPRSPVKLLQCSHCGYFSSRDKA